MSDLLSPWPLFGFADDARPALARAVAGGRPIALATITACPGGGPRPVGTQMTFAEGEISGFLSGGCLEADLAIHADEVLKSGTARRLVYGDGSPWPDIRLLCGARMEILVEPLAPDDTALRALLAAKTARKPVFWRSDGARRVCAAVPPTEPAPDAYDRRYDPPARLVVVGSDPTALAMASLGAQAGFETFLVRPKGPETGPPGIGPLTYLRASPGEALAEIGPDAWTAIAVASHDAALDHEALVRALPSPAFYVGALGARRRLEDRVGGLRAAGVSEGHLARLRSPIGLPLGGKAPWEVAIAVLAEITAERHRLATAEGMTF
jgi:xanthine dehydrogenase accessory factor